MDQEVMTPNESIQLHELLTFKNTCLTKSATMTKFVSDEELKTILDQDVIKGEQHIKELRDLYEEGMEVDF
ncbi:MAG: spore coat protein [Clostridiaceae bacterium]